MKTATTKKMLTLCGLMLVAVAGLSLNGCTTAQDGALLGGGIGAGTGAIIGHSVGHSGPGALIGLGIGALSGALIGDAIDHAPRCYNDYDDVEVHHYRRAPRRVEIYEDYPPPPPVIIERRHYYYDY